jgi:transposase
VLEKDEVSRRLMTVPGIGPVSATAIAASRDLCQGPRLWRLPGHRGPAPII